MRAVGFVVLTVLALRGNTVSAGIPAVDVVEAPGVTCPSTAAVQAALGRLRGGTPASAPSFRLFIDRTADLAHVDLRDGTSRSVLTREIPMRTATDCAHAAEAIALIVERHFRAVEWSDSGVVGGTAPPPLPEPTIVRTAPGLPTSPRPLSPLAPTPASPTAAPMPPATAPAAPAVTPAPAAAAPPNVAATAIVTAPPVNEAPTLRFDPAVLPRFALDAGPAFWSRAATFALALDGRWRVAADSPIEVKIGVLVPPLHTSAAVGSGGSVHVGAVPVAASVGLTEALGKLALAAHLGLLCTIERGQSESIPAPATAWRTVLGLGLGATAAWPVTPRLRITGALDGYRTVLGRSYAVSGVSGAVLDPAPWQAVIVLGAEWVVFP